MSSVTDCKVSLAYCEYNLGLNHVWSVEYLDARYKTDNVVLMDVHIVDGVVHGTKTKLSPVDERFGRKGIYWDTTFSVVAPIQSPKGYNSNGEYVCEHTNKTITGGRYALFHKSGMAITQPITKTTQLIK